MPILSRPNGDACVEAGQNPEGPGPIRTRGARVHSAHVMARLPGVCVVCALCGVAVSACHVADDVRGAVCSAQVSREIPWATHKLHGSHACLRVCVNGRVMQIDRPASSACAVGVGLHNDASKKREKRC